MLGKLTGAWLVVALLAALGLAGGGADRPAAAEEKGAKGGATDLTLVPGSALGVMSFRIADVWNGDFGKAVRKHGAKDIAPMVKEIEDKIGVGPAQMERLTVAFLESPESPVIFLTTNKAYDRVKVLRGLVPGAEEEKFKGHTIHSSGRGLAVCLLNDRTFVAGTSSDVKTVLEGDKRGKEGPLAPALKAAASGKHLAVFGFNAVAFAKLAKGELPPQAGPYKALLKAKTAVLTIDLKDKLQADLRVSFADADAAKAGQKSLQTALKVGQTGLALAIKELTRQKVPAEVLKLLRTVETKAKALPIKQSGETVAASLAVDTNSATLGTVALHVVQQMRDAASRMRSMNNLKQIGLALHNYHDTYGAFPPSAIYDRDGKALLSWRVLILPFIEQDALYREFKLNEPWDSAHNKKLLAKMPKTYSAPTAAKVPPHSTFYQAFVGPGAFFEGKRGIRITDITDGTSNTIAVVEAGKAVPWSKPEDIPYVPGKPIPKLGGVQGGPFNAAFCDGSVRRFAKMPKEATMHALITRNGGEAIPADFDE